MKPSISRRTATLTLVLATALVVGPRPAEAGDFLDTRITYTLGDDDFLKDGGEQIPDSPTFGIGDRGGYEFSFDNLNSSTTGRENELHLVLYKKVEGLLPGLTTEAAAALEIDLSWLESLSPDLAKMFDDDSSYIRIGYAIDAEKRGTKMLDVVLFPLSGDRFRAGYLYDLTWGGKDAFARRKGPTPAFKLGGNHGLFYWWAGMKIVLSESTITCTEEEKKSEACIAAYDNLYGALAGVGVQPVTGLSIDLSGGYIQMARSPFKDTAGELMTAQGASLRLAYGRGLKVGLSSDLRLVRNDPEYLEALATKPSYNPGGGVSWSITAEGNAIAEVLDDPDRVASTKLQWASAAALQFAMQYNFFRFNITGLYQSLAFSLLNNTRQLTPYQAFPDDASVQPQIFAALSADYFFSRVAIMPGMQFGVEVPAAIKTDSFTLYLPDNTIRSGGSKTILFPEGRDKVVLPDNEGRAPVYSLRLTARWYPSEMLTLLAFVQLAVDQNIVVPTVNPDRSVSWGFDDPIRFGAGLTAQARF